MNPISVEEAARRLGASAQFVRVCLQQEKLPIGTAVQMSKSRWRYYINPHLLDQYIGEVGTYDHQPVQ